MLQISTGKFFEEDKKSKHDEKFVFYSNIDIYNDLSILAPEIKIEQVESGKISCYIVTYQLITEKHPVIIKCGEQDFIYQFLLIWSFYFDCIAKNHRSIVQKICRENKVSSYDQQTTAEVCPRTVELGRNINSDEQKGFIEFFNSLMNTDRGTFKSIITGMKIIDDAKESISTNFDLAYSTLVYAIESLAQKHDGFKPKWDDYYPDIRKKIEKSLVDVDEDTSKTIKNTLIEGKQFRLQKRFNSFVTSHTSDAFFHKFLGENTSTLRVSFLERCLKNLYKLRSTFVHELKPLDIMLSSPHSPLSDYTLIFREPYFTYSGLNRLIREVIINFSKEKESKTKETLLDWAKETTSVHTEEVSAKHWIHLPNRFNEKEANMWFFEYVEMLNNKSVIDQTEVMTKIISIFDGVGKMYKRVLLHYYWLYNSIHNKDDKEWRLFVNSKSQFIGGCIHFYVALVYLYNRLSCETKESKGELVNINLDDFDKLYKSYSKERFHKYGLSLSGYTEAALLLAAANVALENNDIDRYEKYLRVALPEVANYRDKYNMINDSMKQKEFVNLSEYFL